MSEKVTDLLKCFFDVFENEKIFQLKYPPGGTKQKKKNVKFPTIHRHLTAFSRLSCLIRVQAVLYWNPRPVDSENGGQRSNRRPK